MSVSGRLTIEAMNEDGRTAGGVSRQSVWNMRLDSIVMALVFVPVVTFQPMLLWMMTTTKTCFWASVLCVVVLVQVSRQFCLLESV